MKTLMFEALLCLMLFGFILLVVTLIKYLIDQLRIVPKFSVRVKVEQELFLVVIYPNLTVSWLADHIAERYFFETGVKVTVKIKDGFGAKMSTDDILWFMVNSGDQLGAEVTVIPIDKDKSNSNEANCLLVKLPESQVKQ